jgi:hypothetical protein
MLFLIGSPNGTASWRRIERQLTRIDNPGEFELPWNGRVVLCRVSTDGKRWTMWNDWCGSIPVFQSRVGKGCVASTLEPAVVAAAGYTPDDFFLPGLVSLLKYGHYLGNWTLFKGMNTVSPDCVAEWNNGRFRSRQLWTIRPSDERWGRSPDELVDEMHALSRQAIVTVLQSQPAWILPLSGGLDSRLLAAVGAEQKSKLQTYTYGHSDWVETVYAKQTATALNLPWKRVPIERDYLVRFTRMWLEWFGSALHCHGMYQVPFLNALDGEPAGPILQGYMGDPLAGNHVRELLASEDGSGGGGPTCDLFCAPEVVEELLVAPSGAEAMEVVHQRVRGDVERVPGARHQQLMFWDFWNRQRLFIFYQPMMYQYYRDVATPFLDRDYARFCMSLPRHLLVDRWLQKEMLRRYYPQLARIGGTFGEPLAGAGRHLLKKGIARVLPRSLRRGCLHEFAATGNRIQIDALHAFGEQSLWPLNRVRQRLGAWLDLGVLEDMYRQAASGDEKAYNQLRPVQAVALHYV